MNFIRFEDYKLATVSEEVLGEKKLIGEDNKAKAIEDSYKHHPQKLVDYNLKDAELVLKILDKTNAIGITVSRAMLTGMSLERVRGSVASFDSLYLRKLNAEGYIAPSGQFTEKEEQIGGGFVRESKPGIYDFIIVLDFKSLYPSIMRTFNIDPLSFERGKKAKKSEKLDKKQWVVAPNGAVFSNDAGLLPEIITALWQERDKAKKRRDEYASQAIKTLMNSMFGVLANPSCRFFNMDMANAITSYGRHLSKLTAEKIEELGYDVIYGDTDSVFVNCNCKSYDEAYKTGEKIEKHIDDFYPKYVRDNYARESCIDLEIDRIFLHFMMPRVRGSEEGAKKRYAGIVIGDDGKESLDVTGLEFVRRDWTDLAKDFQAKLLELIFNKENPVSYVKEIVKELRAGKLDEKLVYRKAIRKELEGYTKTTPPHVKAARKLEDAGIPITSSLIDYVITTDGPEPVQLLVKRKKKDIDYEHYIEKQLRPIADAILGFYDTNFDDILAGNTQKTLFGY